MYYDGISERISVKVFAVFDPDQPAAFRDDPGLLRHDRK
jgi:hypothetical protein